METKAHYALVGFFAIAFVAAAALFIVWLGQLRFDQTFKEFDISFVGPVRGLSVAGEVRFNGIKVGEVTRLAFDRDDPRNVIARIRVAQDTPVSSTSVAQLEPLGLTGVNYIQLSSGEATSEPLVPLPGQDVPVIEAERAQLESLLSSGETIAESASDALRKVNELLTEENTTEIAAIIMNIRLLTEQLADDSEAGLVTRAGLTLDEVRAAVESFTKLADGADALVNNDLARLLREATEASQKVEAAASQATAILESAHGPVVRFTNEGLDDLALAIGDMRRVLNELEAIAVGVEDNPAAFVAGGRRQEVEIPR
jgi:phospholipid/cholesterol/gamma-HCH transport system substrate-binding protein